MTELEYRNAIDAAEQENRALLRQLESARIENVALALKVESLSREVNELRTNTLTPAIIEAALDKVLSKRAKR